MWFGPTLRPRNLPAGKHMVKVVDGNTFLNGIYNWPKERYFWRNGALQLCFCAKNLCSVRNKGLLPVRAWGP